MLPAREINDTTEDVQSRLMSVAHRYAQDHANDVNIAGMVLYGSLSTGAAPELTPLSDVDIALVLRSDLPEHFTEHRLRDGVKVDVLLFALPDVVSLGETPPERLWEHGWVSQFLIKSFLRGTPETILYDPDGAIARAKQTLCDRRSYAALALPDCRRWLHEYETGDLEQANQSLQAGNFTDALAQAGGALWMLGVGVRTLAATKQTPTAAERLGIPAFADAESELRSLLAPSPDAFEGYRQAAHALWRQTPFPRRP